MADIRIKVAKDKAKLVKVKTRFSLSGYDDTKRFDFAEIRALA